VIRLSRGGVREALDWERNPAIELHHMHDQLFEHWAKSSGIAGPEDFGSVINRHGPAAHVDGLEHGRFPHDIGTLGRYGRVFDQLPRARHPWRPLPVETGLDGVAAAGLSVTRPSVDRS
jgi:hypothetical protein